MLRTAVISLLFFVQQAVPVEASGDTLLIMRVDMLRLTNIGSETDTASYMYRYELTNLDTKERYYGYASRFNGLFVESVTPGLYCVSVIYLTDADKVEYCGEPYFRATASAVNNAGHWRFGMSGDRKISKLLFSNQYAESVLEDVIKVEALSGE